MLVFVCIAIPSIGTVLKPFVAEAVFVLLCMAFARVDTAALRVYLRRPTLLVAAAGSWALPPSRGTRPRSTASTSS